MTNAFFAPALLPSILALAFASVLASLFSQPIDPRCPPAERSTRLNSALIRAAPMPAITRATDMEDLLTMMAGPLKTSRFHAHDDTPTITPGQRRTSPLNHACSKLCGPCGANNSRGGGTTLHPGSG
jgi:hypothetical protein